MKDQSLEFYQKVIGTLAKAEVPFLVGGTFAVKYYTGIKRPTKDIDIFCKASDYPRILQILNQANYKIEIVDDRWLAKVYQGKYYADIIFGAVPMVWPIDDGWINRAELGEVLGHQVKITPPEELIISKMYRQGRSQYDGADVTHLILKKGKNLDWKLLLNRAEPNWEVLLAHLILFRFIYPSDRDIVPQWVMETLLEKIKIQLEMPPPKEKICKGSLLSHTQYQIAYTDWGYKDMTDFFYKGEYYADPKTYEK